MENTSSARSMITTILFGKSHQDKALVGNTVLGNKCFSPEISMYMKGVMCQNNWMCCVINTPDLYHGPQPDSKEQEVLEELKPSFPKARVFLLIMQDHHVSSEEIKMFKLLKKTYGNDVVHNTIVVLIRSEGNLVQPQAEQNISRILHDCGGRVCSFKHGMKTEELRIQLMTQYERMQQKFGAEHVYETDDVSENPNDEKSAKENARYKPAEENLMTQYESMQQKFGAESVHQTVDVPEKPNDEKSVKENARHEPTEEKPVAVVSNGVKNVMTIVLLGQTGSGKSATGNTILAKRHFESCTSSKAITQECKGAEGLVCGIKVRVVDTPDFFDKDLKSPKIHIQKCKELSQPGPIVYLLVMHMGRFTEGEREIILKLQETFGEDMIEKTVILFTGKEKLKGEHLHDFIRNADPNLTQLIEKTGSRCHAFNNNDNNRHQVIELIGMILEKLFTEDYVNEHFPEYKIIEHKDCRLL